MDASSAFASGTTTARAPARRASMASGSTPRTDFSSPDSASSPTKWTPAMLSVVISSTEASTPIAIGRSNPVPSLRRSPGARFTMMRFCGSETPRFRTAAATRTFASCTAPVASPTRWKPGIPSAASTSTSTGIACTPRTAPERMRTSMHVRSAEAVPWRCRRDRAGRRARGNGRACAPRPTDGRRRTRCGRRANARSRFANSSEASRRGAAAGSGEAARGGARDPPSRGGAPAAPPLGRGRSPR